MFNGSIAVEIYAKPLGMLLTILFAGSTLIYLYRFFAGAEGKDVLSRAQRPEGRAPRKTVLTTVALAYVISRLLLFAGGAFWAHRQGYLSDYLHNLPDIWSRWDAPHYVGLIKNWYVNVGDPRFHIVFFPLYPAIGRLLHLATGLSALACGYLISNLAFLGCGIAMFRLVELSQGAAGGARATWLFMLSPLTLFCSVPYTESVFLLTTLLAVYCARKGRFVWAVVFGALSANARMLGMATAIPIFYELLRASHDKPLKRYALSALKVIPVSLGLLAYLLLNYEVTGDPLRFMTYQSEHWSQNFGSLFNTAAYSFRNALDYESFYYRIGVWMPQIVAMILILAIMISVLRSAHPGDMGYYAVYFYAAVAPTWLLSGPRYLTALYAVYPALALLTRKRWAFGALCCVSAALCALAGAMYSVVGYIL